jgi:hypothetical protein
MNREPNGLAPLRVTVFGNYDALDVVSRKNAFAIKELADRPPCRGKIDCVRLDPAATARSSLGPAAYSEYEQVFGSRLVARRARHQVLGGLETIDLLLESGDLFIPRQLGQTPQCEITKRSQTQKSLAEVERHQEVV